MPCPFAKFAALAAESGSSYSHYHDYHPKQQQQQQQQHAPATSPSTLPPLSEHLKTATAKAHREVESSRGVRKLMGFSSGQDDADDGFVFGRLDYVRWMVMLGCIYAALESSILAQDASIQSMLGPLLRSRPSSSDASLMSHLLRFPAVMTDIQAHLDVLQQSTGNEQGAGLTWNELIEDVRDLRMSQDEEGEEGDASLNELKQLMASIPQQALLSTSTLSAEHIELLSPAQAQATLVYVRRLVSLSTPTPGFASDLLLSHAYVRYLGDLSGGQHIRRRIEKLFPVEAAAMGSSSSSSSQDAGFAFYAFRKPQSYTGSESSWHHVLKDAFRTAMDSAIGATSTSATTKNTLLDLQGKEASLAFELNKDLFESIIGNSPTTDIPPLPTLEQEQHAVVVQATSIPKATMTTTPSGCPIAATVKFLTAITAAKHHHNQQPSPSSNTLLLHGLPLYSHVLPFTFLGLAVLVGGTSIALNSM